MNVFTTATIRQLLGVELEFSSTFVCWKSIAHALEVSLGLSLTNPMRIVHGQDPSPFNPFPHDGLGAVERRPVGLDGAVGALLFLLFGFGAPFPFSTLLPTFLPVRSSFCG